jgi:hypothetical protein
LFKLGVRYFLFAVARGHIYGNANRTREIRIGWIGASLQGRPMGGSIVGVASLFAG